MNDSYSYEDFRKEWLSSSPEIICRTSGSTGIPSVIALPKEQVRQSAWRTISFFGLSRGSRLHSCISPEFIGGKMQMVRAIEAGCRFSWELPSNRPLANESSAGRRISLLSVVPSQMLHILGNKRNIPEIDAMLVGGSPIPQKLREQISGSGLNVWESYGMTETASHIALRPVVQVGLEKEEPFRPLPGISIGVAEQGCSIGRLRIAIEGWQTLTTNDVAEVFPDQSFRILGRADNVIITGARKIYPESIEKKLSVIFDFPFFLTSEPDDKWGERLVMVAETDKTRHPKSEIVARCRSLCPGYETPKAVYYTSALPRTPNGKIMRRAVQK